MHHLTALLTPLRNALGSVSGRDAGFWLVTALIALLLPSPFAAPVLVARLNRPRTTHQE